MTRTAVIVLALVLLGGLASQALAEQTTFHVRPTIKMKRTTNGDRFSGKLKSKEHACEANRRIKLHHRNVSQEQESGVIAKLRTNGEGEWRFRPNKNQNGDRFATPGDYRVKVGEKKVSTGSGEITCRSKNSSSLFVG